MEMDIVKSINLSKDYKKFRALNKVNITVKQGEIYGLVGDNGAGKTTFLKLLAGQISASEGSFSLFGKESNAGKAEARSRIGVMIEETGFYPNMTIAQNLEYYRRMKAVAGKEAVEEALSLTGLMPYSKKKCKAMSMGMKQRLGLAIALLGKPEFLILDEPINGLDPSGIVEVRNLLLKLNKERNTTILLSSHILSELEQIATVYGFLHKGNLVEQITVEQLKENCADYIEIKVGDAARFSVLLERKLGHTNYSVLPDNSIHIFEPGEQIERYSNLAAEEGLPVLGLGRRKKSLEEYYADVKRRGMELC